MFTSVVFFYFIEKANTRFFFIPVALNTKVTEDAHRADQY